MQQGAPFIIGEWRTRTIISVRLMYVLFAVSPLPLFLSLEKGKSKEESALARLSK